MSTPPLMSGDPKPRKFVTLFPQKGLLICVLLLCFFSLMTIAGCMSKPLMGDESWMDKLLLLVRAPYVGLQALWIAGGFAVMIGASFIPTRFYIRLQNWIYWGNVGLLVLVLVAGKTTGGATRWVTIPFVTNLLGDRTIQFSELAKVAIILCLAQRISQHEGEMNDFRQLVPILLYFALPFVLILLQPDLGTAVVYAVVLVVMLFVGGLRLRIFSIGIGSFVALLPVAWLLMEEYQRNRILLFIDPSRGSVSQTLQIDRAMAAFGSGGLFGRGMFDTTSMGQLNMLPAKHNDFIFSMVGECFGFAGVVLLLGMYIYLCWRLYKAAKQADSLFGSLVCMGIMGMQMAHIFENLGMNIGIMPITGISLPFFSYGGSFMLTNMMTMGLVLALTRESAGAEEDTQLAPSLLRVNPWRKRRLPTLER